jgi:hypothetical protein
VTQVEPIDPHDAFYRGSAEDKLRTSDGSEHPDLRFSDGARVTPPQDRTQFDAAALAVAALAGALAVFSDPGPYDTMSAVTGITVLIIIVAYEHDRRRTPWQSAALAATFAFVSLLVVGFFWELLKGGFTLAGECYPPGGDCTPNERESAVPPLGLAGLWILIGGGILAGDRFRQRRRPEPVVSVVTPSPAASTPPSAAPAPVVPAVPHDSGADRKDAWDKADVLAKWVAGIVVAAIGGWASSRITRFQLDAAQRSTTAQIASQESAQLRQVLDSIAQAKDSESRRRLVALLP